MADAVVAIDADKKIIRMNQAAAELFFLPSGGVGGGAWRDPQLLHIGDGGLHPAT